MMKRSSLFAFTVALIVMCGASQSGATSLIVNGSFETPNQNGGWSLVAAGDVPGWVNLSGNDQGGLELDTSAADVGGPAYQGVQSLELNGAAFDSATQDVTGLTVGDTYNLSWAYGYRPSSGDEQTNVYFGGVLIATDVDPGASNSSLEWFLNSYAVTATSTSEELTFMAIATSGSDNLGNEIDAVSLVPAPEPGTLFLFGTGLLGLALFVRRKHLRNK